VKDLSAPDPYKILPIVMCITMISSTMLQPMPPPTDPSQKMQRVMMTWLMPIVLTWFFFFSAPSGLVLYWMVSNVAGVLIQLGINKLTAEAPQQPEPAPETGSKSGKGKARERGRVPAKSSSEA
jgi:YidC/Oxa1 family membrane protein insertase